MGEIFLARQAIAGVNRLVVLKRLLPELAEDPVQLAMFVDEARIAANLAHPAIVQVHEFGEDAQGHFIVMEFVPGHNVGRLLGRAKREQRELPVQLGAYIVYEVARALDHAHRAVDTDGSPLEIVHRDISPSNVLVSFHGDVKLMDFGIARAANRTHKTNDGSIRGKFAYMPPEQLRGRDVDARSDVFAAGIVLWELTLGRRLFDGPSDFETMRAALEMPIPRPTSIDPNYPAVLERIVMRALERAPDRRTASAAELATELRSYLRTNPADRDDLVALMRELFADEVDEVVRLEAEHTVPGSNDAMPTAPLIEVVAALRSEPGDTVAALRSEPGDTVAALRSEPGDTVAESPRRRGRTVVGLVLAGALVVSGAMVARSYLVAADAAHSAVDAGPIALATTSDARSLPPQPERLDARAASAADAGAPADATPSTSDRRTTTAQQSPVHRRPPETRTTAPPEPPPDAPPQPSPPALSVTVAIGVQGGSSSSVYLTSDASCTKPALPTRCTMRPGSHNVHFRVVGGSEFDAKLDAAASASHCFVDLASHRIACR